MENIASRGRVTGKVAFVTGAAMGLGQAIAELLACEGATVIVADIDHAAASFTVAEIKAKGAAAEAWIMDVAQEDAWDQAMEMLVDRHGGLDILVNNAGVGTQGDMEMAFDLWRRVISINLDSVFLGTRAAIRTMRAGNRSGSIVNISSTMGFVAQANTAAYSASKGGVRSLTKAAALHCAAHKLPIRVNSVHPGACMTPLLRHFADEHPGGLDEQIALHPIGHLGDPVDIAYGVLYLASEESKFSTGSELVIDGGFLAR